MARPDEKKRKDQWIPVDGPVPTEKKPTDTRGWEPPPPSSATKETVAGQPKPAPKPTTPAQRAVSPEERALWADPVLSPWAPEPSKPVAPAAQPTAAFLGPATTSCPRCSTRITYARNGSPPWEAECKNCGAKGRFWK
ncbi:MAG TPA: hypothetical protein VGB18_03280 [Candidatus Thermoplasmatota archaeon]